MARGRSFVRGSAPRRVNKWALGPGSELVTSIATSANTIIGSGVVLATESQVTIVRLRGDLLLYISGIGAALDGYNWAFGIGITNAEAFSVGGAASLPDPHDDSEWDGWFYHKYGTCYSPESTLNSGGGPSFMRVEVDSKAMRKWSENYTVFAVLSTTEVGSAIMKVQFNSRMLVKLS